MRIPALHGVIERRLLINYRIAPEVLAALLPAPFRPQLVRGCGIAGLCLIRLRRVRPCCLPLPWGLSSENAAHRAAVEWLDGGVVHRGVHVRRRDTSSRLNALAGGRVFPGAHHLAGFEVDESVEAWSVAFRSAGGTGRAAVRVRLATRVPRGSVFGSLDEASSFFRAGSLGYSDAGEPGRFQGLELRCRTWHLEPLAIESARSSFFDDRTLFPE